MSNFELAWNDGGNREQEFERPGTFGVDTRGAATIDASGQTLTPEQGGVRAAAMISSPALEISANAKQHGAMSNVVQDFPRMRFLMSALAWLALCYHIYLVNLGCCAETGIAWAPGTNGGFCTCGGQGAECSENDYGRYNECCMHGSCLSRLRPQNETCSGQQCDADGSNCEDTQCGSFCTVIDASELELPARTPKSCTCCMPKMHENGKYDEAGGQIVLSFAVFFSMWYLSFMTDMNFHVMAVVFPIFAICDQGGGDADARMQRITRIFGHCCGTRFGFLECDKQDNGSLFNRLKRRKKPVAGAEAFTAFTRSACEEQPQICFHNECWHMVRSGKHSRREVTHRAQEHYATESDERSAVPLLPARAGDGWEIPYLNAAGEPCVARSRNGLIELRVTLELCFETLEEHTEFTQRADRFRMDNQFDVSQRNWVAVKINQERAYVCELEEGKTPKCLSENYFYLCSCLALGWLYQVWYDSLTTPVELHLRKTIRKKPSEASAAAQFPDSRHTPARSTPARSTPVTQEGIDYWSRRLGGRTPAPAAQTMVREPSEVRVIVETL